MPVIWCCGWVLMLCAVRPPSSIVLSLPDLAVEGALSGCAGASRALASHSGHVFVGGGDGRVCVLALPEKDGWEAASAQAAMSGIAITDDEEIQRCLGGN